MLKLPERRFALWNWIARTFSTSVAGIITSGQGTYYVVFDIYLTFFSMLSLG